MNLPTKITFSRIIATIILIVFLFVLSLIPDLSLHPLGNTQINPIYLGVFVFFVLAAYTDHLDGHLARKNNQITDLGKFLDPVADKLLINTMLIFLIAPASYAVGQNATVSMWCVIIMVARDIVVDALRFVAAKKNIVIAANIFGKLKTVLQMVAIGVVLLNGFPFNYFDADWPQYLHISDIIVYIATFVSFLSGVIYVWQNRKAFLGE